MTIKRGILSLRVTMICDLCGATESVEYSYTDGNMSPLPGDWIGQVTTPFEYKDALHGVEMAIVPDLGDEMVFCSRKCACAWFDARVGTAKARWLERILNEKAAANE